MLKIEKFVTASPEQWEIIIEGMRNPKNSWDRMDSLFFDDTKGHLCTLDQYVGKATFIDIGPNDHKLMDALNEGGPVHAKYRRMIPVWVTITAPLYWWKEFDTYKVGTVCNSCSTMHKIHAKKFTLEDFSCEKLMNLTTQDIPYHSNVMLVFDYRNVMRNTIDALNNAREYYLETKDKRYWEQMIQLLPTSYNQKRTILLNYEVLVNIYTWRKNHKLDEWHTFCNWIEELPYSELITGRVEEDE